MQIVSPILKSPWLRRLKPRLNPPTGPLTLERQLIKIRDLPLRLRGLRIIQLSDFHFDGIGLSPRQLQQAIALANAQSPDLICLTGDYVTDDPQPIHHLAPALKQLRSTYGSYAVLGNHDLGQRGSRQVVTEALTQAGVRVLWNEIVYPFRSKPDGNAVTRPDQTQLDQTQPEFALVGLADMRSRSFLPATVFAALDPAIPRLVLSHNPDSAEILQQWRVDLQLSGHSHGGQICLPGGEPVLGLLAPWVEQLPWRFKRKLRSLTRIVQHWEWAAGLHEVGDNLLYVNRGLGTYLPGRLFCPPEVTLITLA